MSCEMLFHGNSFQQVQWVSFPGFCAESLNRVSFFVPTQFKLSEIRFQQQMFKFSYIITGLSFSHTLSSLWWAGWESISLHFSDVHLSTDPLRFLL